MGQTPFHGLTEAQVVISLSTYSSCTPVLPGEVDNIEIDDRIRAIIKECWNKPPNRPTCNTIRATIAGTDTRDTRPKTTTKAQNGLPFLRAMRANVDFRVDYNRVRRVLDEVRNGRWIFLAFKFNIRIFQAHQAKGLVIN